VEHALLTPVTFAIIPLFALANAGVSLHSGSGLHWGNPTLWGVLMGLLIGKPLGVLLAVWVAVKSGIASLPEGGTWRQMIGVSVLCGIGFTMSLFVGNLAFSVREEYLVATKLGILAASLLSGLVGGVILAEGRRLRKSAGV
jgi:Na+:H+ antiporter, NhaA family